MAYTLTIGQSIVDSGTTTTTNLVNGTNIIKFSIYALPGCTFKIDKSSNEITINNTGLFNFSLPEHMYESNMGIQALYITNETQQLLAAAGAKLVVDYVNCTTN